MAVRTGLGEIPAVFLDPKAIKRAREPVTLDAYARARADVAGNYEYVASQEQWDAVQSATNVAVLRNKWRFRLVP